MKKNSIYIHIPFCEKKCFYCSFVVFVNQKHHLDHYLHGLSEEIRGVPKQKIFSLYIGGGTPSVIGEKQWEVLFDAMHKQFIFDPKIECTVELNPEHITGSYIKVLKNLGVNRFSLGMQTLQDKYLRFLGRHHTCKSAINAFHVLRNEGIKNINLDFMYGFSQQTTCELKKDLKAIIELQSDHVSIYSLTIEEKSLFSVKNVKLANKAKQAKQYCLVTDTLEKAGFKQYEISNFAKPRKEAEHNKHYWQGGNYLGFGVGAHSHANGRRFWNTPRLKEYIRKIKAQQSPQDGYEQLQKKEQLIEALLFGLRMNKGVDIKQMEQLYKCELSGEKKRQINQFVDQGLFELLGGCIKATRRGQLVLDEISARLI